MRYQKPLTKASLLRQNQGEKDSTRVANPRQGAPCLHEYGFHQSSFVLSKSPHQTLPTSKSACKLLLNKKEINAALMFLLQITYNIQLPLIRLVYCKRHTTPTRTDRDIPPEAERIRRTSGTLVALLTTERRTEMRKKI